MRYSNLFVWLRDRSRARDADCMGKILSGNSIDLHGNTKGKEGWKS